MIKQKNENLENYLSQNDMGKQLLTNIKEIQIVNTEKSEFSNFIKTISNLI
jgi:hypothetical protein